MDRARDEAEAQRLRALLATGLLDSEPEAAFDKFTRLAAKFLDVPTALISLVDDHRQFFKSAVGLSGPIAARRETPLSHSFCKEVVASRKPLIVSDARIHALLSKNKAVTELSVIAYAGMPLITSEDHALGALCVVHPKPHEWTQEELDVLSDLAAAVVTEIELREVANVLKKNDAFQRAVFEGIEAGLILVDAMRRINWVNSSAEWLLGYGPGELRGMRWFDLADARDREEDRELHAQLLEQSRTRVAQERRLKRKDGTWTSLRVTLSTIRQDNVVRVLVALSENNESKLLAQQLRQSEERYRSLAKNLPDCALLSFDKELRHVTVEGEAMLNAVGLSSEAMRGKTMEELASPVNRKLWDAAYRAALRGESAVLEVTRGDMWFTNHVAPLYDTSGAILGGMVLIRNTTESKRLRDQLRQQSGQLQLLQRIVAETEGPSSGLALMKSCLELLCAHTQSEVGHVFMRDQDAFVSTELWRVDDELTRRPFVRASTGLRFPVGEGLPGAAFSAHAAVAMVDVATDDSFVRAAPAAASGLHAGFAVPIAVRNEVMFVIECFSTRVRALDKTLLETMTSVGKLLGRVVECEQLSANIATLTTLR